MTATAKRLLEDALSLSVDERAELVEALSDSLELAPEDLGPEWTEEIASRIDQIVSGEVKPVRWDEVEARIRERLVSE